MPDLPWPGVPYVPIMELGYPIELGDEFRYDQARYDTTGRYGPWWAWRTVTCDVESANMVRGATSPSQRPSSATCSLRVRAPADGSLSPWYRDPATGDRPNRANLPMRVGITDGAEQWWLFTGWVDTWHDTDDAADLPTITITASDGFKMLANLDQAEQPPAGAGETAGPRIDRVLTRAGWTANRDLAPGSVPLQATTLAQPALEEIFLTADTEAGVVWVDVAGAFRFVDRDWLRNKASVTDWRIGDGTIDPAAVCPSLIATVADDMDIANVVGIARVGGTAQWLEEPQSIAKYGRHSWSRFDLPYRDDADTAALLAVQLSDRANRDYHVQAVMITPTSEPDAWPVTLNVDLFDTVWITRTRGGDALDELAQVIGVDHSLEPGVVVTVLTLGARIRQTNARYDAALYDVARYSAA